MFQLLHDSVQAALEIMKPESQTTADLLLDKQGQVVQSTTHLETPLSLLMKRKDAVFVGSHFRSAIVVALAPAFCLRRDRLRLRFCSQMSDSVFQDLCKSTSAHRAGEERRYVEDDVCSIFDEFVGRGEAGDGGVK